MACFPEHIAAGLFFYDSLYIKGFIYLHHTAYISTEVFYVWCMFVLVCTRGAVPACMYIYVVASCLHSMPSFVLLLLVYLRQGLSLYLGLMGLARLVASKLQRSMCPLSPDFVDARLESELRSS